MLKIKFQKSRLLVIIITILLLLSSCSTNNSKANEITTLFESVGLSWLKDSRCEFGCVFGVEPGKTSFDDAHNILSEIEEIEPGSIENRTYLDFNEEIECINFSFLNENYRCSISFKNKIAEEIDINSYGGIVITEIEQLVELLGEPDYFYYGKKNPEVRGCFVTFIWKDLRVLASSSDGKIPLFAEDLCGNLEKNNYKVSKDLHIHKIVIVSQNLFDEYKQNEAPNWVGFIEEN
jgi:hypothetical protein